MTLKAKDRPVNPILVESQGKIIESNVTDRDAANISNSCYAEDEKGFRDCHSK